MRAEPVHAQRPTRPADVGNPTSASILESASALQGWGRFYLFEADAPTDFAEDPLVPVAVFPCAFDALEALAPKIWALRGSDGRIWYWAPVPEESPGDGPRPTFPAGDDRVLVALDATRRRYYVRRCPRDGPLTRSQAWRSLEPIEQDFLSYARGDLLRFFNQAFARGVPTPTGGVPP